jgi:hypothetical protein
MRLANCLKARREGQDIIDFGMGNPNAATPSARRNTYVCKI